LNRRHFLGSVAASAAAAATARCRLSAPERRPIEPAQPDSCRLRPVRVSPDREIRTVAGLRPYRPSGFLVRAEKLGDMLVVHNYGHGGAGITLCWGTSKLALEAIPPELRGDVGVLGCGAVGLTTARLLQEAGARVTIYAKELPPNTTSNVAGGQWFPFFLSDPARRTPEFLRQLVAASEYSYRRYQTMVGPRYGVRWIRNYMAGNEPWHEGGLLSASGPLAAMLPELKDLSASEHPFAAYAYVRQFDSMLIEPPIYLEALLAEVRTAGGTIRVTDFSDRDAVRRLPHRAVVNCTGLGAKALFGDDELTPVKGQLTILLPQPEVDYIVLRGELYMFPRSDGILLGGTHENGVWSLEPDPEARKRILAGHRAFFDGFRPCERRARASAG
jgi:D-amino-acid oxidase